MRKKYLARNGAPFKTEDAQSIGEFIERNKGKTTQELLDAIKEAKTEKIYDYIQWNDKKASYLFRLQQVRNIVNHIEIKIIQEPLRPAIRAFYSVSPFGEKDNVYVNVETAFTNENYRLQIIERAKTELVNWKERYQQYEELAPIIQAIQDYLGEKLIELTT